MRFHFNFKIWSNKEQKYIGGSFGLIDIDEADLPRLKRCWQRWLRIGYPKCKNCGNCDLCNGGKPHLLWTMGQNDDKIYFQDKYITHNLTTLALVDISIIFKDFQSHAHKIVTNNT